MSERWPYGTVVEHVMQDGLGGVIVMVVEDSLRRLMLTTLSDPRQLLQPDTFYEEVWEWTSYRLWWTRVEGS